MSRVYIPAGYRAAVMAIKRGAPADIARTDAIHDRQRSIAADMFNGIMSGRISEAHQFAIYGDNVTIYHRSTRGEHVQESHFYRSKDGTWTAQSHRDIITPDDIQFQGGSYLTTTA